ncbi:sensor histidine kinase [Caldimonas sp.]|uniref:sensor histidine kinase n=1 Tax=Caldimonas sp. TaxID=2838790 RepID=UPI00307EDDEF
MRPFSAPSSWSLRGVWREVLRRLRRIHQDLQAAAARSGQVPARLLRRLAVLKLALPLALALGVGMLWITERGYERLAHTYAELKGSRVFSANLDSLAFLAARADATQAEYLLTRTPDSLWRHRSTLQQIVALYQPLLEGGLPHADPQDLAVALRYIDAEREELARLDALGPSATPAQIDAVLQPSPVSDGSLRQAIGRMVARERALLERAEAEAAGELQRQRWVSLGTLVAGLMLLVLLFQAYRGEFEEEQRMAQRLQQERDRLERAVRLRTRELSELATHLQEVAEQEKARLARELHDELGALLTASKMDVGLLLRRGLQLPQEAIEALQRVQSNLEQGVQIKRRVIEGLMPSTLSHLGLVAALETLADEVQAQSGLHIERDLPEALELDRERSLAVFRLVQEALTNVQKHARASRVDLVLETRGDRLLLRLRDDGVGLDPAQTRKLKSHGLRGMKHRVDAFGGRFEIGPAAGGGTVLTVEIPLTPVPEAADDTDI